MTRQRIEIIKGINLEGPEIALGLMPETARHDQQSVSRYARPKLFTLKRLEHP